MSDASRERTVIRTRRVPSDVRLPHDARVLSPTPRVAAALGAPFASPATHAARIHRGAGGTVATRLTAWRALARAIDETLDPADPLGARRTLAGPIRELLRAGLDAIPDDPALSRRTRDAIRAARRYRTLLAELGEVDPAEVFHAAERALRAGAAIPTRLAVVAPRGLGADAAAFLDAAAAPGSVVVVGPEDGVLAGRLAARGWRTREDAATPARPGERLAAAFLDGAAAADGDAAAYAFATQEEEARWVLARVKALLASGVSARDVVVAARDDAAVSGPLAAVAWEAGVPLRAAHAVRVIDTRLGGWLDDLREAAARGAPFEETARLAAHGLAGRLPPEAWRRARETRPEGVDGWRAIDPRAASLDWPAEDAAAGWKARFDATLAAFGVEDGADLPPRDAAVLETVRAGVADACRPADRRTTRRAFLRDLEDLLALLTVRKDPPPAPDRPEAVELHALHALAGARVPHLFVLGAVEGGLPAGLRDEPVLDFADRARLAAAGVPIDGAAERAREEEAAFAALLRVAEGPVVLGVPGRAAGEARLPSPYLGRLGLRPEPAPDREPASVEERRSRVLQAAPGEDPRDPVLAEARRAWRVERRRESAAPPDGHDGVAGRSFDPAARRLSATQIEELGGCPFRWFVHRVLHVREPEEAEETVSPRLRGSLWHAALHRAVEAGAARAAGEDDAALRAAIEAALPEAFAAAEEEVGVPAGRAWAKARVSELRTLRRAVRSDAFLAPGARPEAFETAFAGTWRGLRVQGRIDRVDAGPAGVELVDYKSGTSAPKGAQAPDGRGWIDVQLPLYLETAGRDLAGDRPLAAARYLSVRTGETLREAAPGAKDAELAELAGRVRARLTEGRFPVEPDRRRDVCRTCDLTAVCRVGPRVDRKREAVRAAGEEGP